MKEINGLYVERNEKGEINLYGAITCQGYKTIQVITSTKNQPALMVERWGQKYTNKYICEVLKARPTHNFVGYLAGGPLSYPVDPKNVIFS